MRVLECSSAGDSRFSALYAHVDIRTSDTTAERYTIEEWYQLTKRVGNNPAPTNWKQMKGKKPTHFHILGHDYPLNAGWAWYELLWVKYLDQNPDLVAYARNFNAFTDKFARPGTISQADVIRTYVLQGREEIIRRNKWFSDEMGRNKK